MGIIRKMTAEDIDGVLKIERACFTAEAWPRGDFEALAGEESGVTASLVYIADGEVGGYISGSCICGELEIYSVAVDPSLRRKGVAGALICELERLEKPAAAFLEVRESNFAARSLYTSLGFWEFGRRAGYYSRPDEDAITMKKEYKD